MWGIHGGKTGDAESLFIEKGCIALGWAEVGDLSGVQGNRDAFKDLIDRTFPDSAVGAIRNTGGQLYRFVHELKNGDLVLFPAKRDRKIHVGEVTGAYQFDKRTEPTYPHRRSVKWLKSFPRTQFSQGALYEIGSALSLFLVKNYAEEFRAAIDGKSKPAQVATDETVNEVSADVEDRTRDYILQVLSQQLKGVPLESFVAHLLECMGYRTRLQPDGKTGPIDILAFKDELGIEPPIIKVQVKSGDSDIDLKDVSHLFSHVDAKEFGIFVSLSGFTNRAKEFARAKSNVRMIDGPQLVDLIFRHYDSFSSRFKGMIPLRQVWVPGK